ncbi:MAG: cobalamin-binding protein [Gemmataceae bacterium]|nr:cobalamin-binding protein [Gemmataceae bacterium]
MGSDARPRVVSLIASATEIVCALGLEEQLVGRSHECDFPQSIRRLPVCTEPRFNVEGTSREIDERVKQTLQDEISVYRVFEDRLRELRPDVIVTQSHCAVCAVSETDVERALGAWPGTGTGIKPRVISLAPQGLDDVWASIEAVADALDVSERGQALVARLRGRIRAIAERAAPLARPTVACLEWLDPLMAGGNWVPELVEAAGGINLFGSAGRHSPWMSWDELETRDPDVIIALPCGFDLERTTAEMCCLTSNPRWPTLRAVRSGNVVATDGNQYFNRPGPRLVESLEILAEILHPGEFQFGHRGTGWMLLHQPEA